MKKCPKCQLEKPLTEFYQRKKHRTGEYYEKCKDCMKNRGRKYYHQNHERQLKLASVRKEKYKEERRKLIAQFKKDKPCMDCGKMYSPWIMDFDHREGEIKISSISSMVIWRTSNIEKIKLEIAKCDLVCSNCHRQRTHDRLQRVKFAGIANVVKAPL